MAELANLSRARELCRTGAARELRLAARLTQAEIADRCGVEASAISRWENGDGPGARVPRGRAAEIYAAILVVLEAAYGDVQ